jgi:ribonuclease G
MTNELIINVTPQETRVALLEDRALAELYIERAKDRGIVGNIYKGKVMKVLPGMQAAFVDGVGTVRLSLTLDVSGKVEDYEEMGFHVTMATTSIHSPLLNLSSPRSGDWCRFRNPNRTRITSCHPSGRYLVFMPTVDHVGVSRRIKDERTKDCERSCKPSNLSGGFITRTASEAPKRRRFVDMSSCFTGNVRSERVNPPRRSSR